MMMSFTAFSQKDTTSTKVPIPVTVLREIAKDLTLGDLAKEELKITQVQLKEANNKIETQSQIIELLRKNENYYVQIIEKGETSYVTLKDYVDKLEQENKKIKVRSKFKTVLLGGVIGGLIYLLITK
jgi:hypothetical protein